MLMEILGISRILYLSTIDFDLAMVIDVYRSMSILTKITIVYLLSFLSNKNYNLTSALLSKFNILKYKCKLN